ncbi:hypothetical protein GCM10010495_18000 [Kitasatospora herbaricolor]|uniref:hypothetical protein n=1 Tax=Kitasatospora herbaricolor TaxID=68217 RepID=UPI0017484546|nr:hypothetical protein [Kitasatospora herbaricolor]MDQ0308248.1 hypothetical protein [Kitasatospora herbaricolor]GGV06275.1 hypothetical protein GCM10010495_18000 [Kitasatospora herbaricolor]
MSDYDYIPGGGWQVAGLNDDGTGWSEPVIAWEFVMGSGCPVLAKAGTLLVGDPAARGGVTAGWWLVPPGEKPETSRYRPTTTKGAAR